MPIDTQRRLKKGRDPPRSMPVPCSMRVYRDCALLCCPLYAMLVDRFCIVHNLLNVLKLLYSRKLLNLP